MKRVFLICGQGGSGKDTFANYLAHFLYKLDEPYIIRPNAYGVKSIAYESFDWNGEKDAKGRQLLIDITNIGYNLDEHFWEKKTCSYLETLPHSNANLIIPDWRYEQSEKYFRQYFSGAEVITIRINKDIDSSNKTHEHDSSEKDYLNFKCDFDINNNGNLEELKLEAYKLIQKLILRGRWEGNVQNN